MITNVEVLNEDWMRGKVASGAVGITSLHNTAAPYPATHILNPLLEFANPVQVLRSLLVLWLLFPSRYAPSPKSNLPKIDLTRPRKHGDDSI